MTKMSVVDTQRIKRRTTEDIKWAIGVECGSDLMDQVRLMEHNTKIIKSSALVGSTANQRVAVQTVEYLVVINRISDQNRRGWK